MASSDGPRAGRMRNRRWRLGPSVPSRAEFRLTGLAVGYGLLELSLPGEMLPLWSILFALAAGALLLLLGASWLVRLLVTVIEDLRHLRFRTWRWLVQPALIGILLFAWAYDLPLMARVRMSEGALIRGVRSADESSEFGRYVGLVWVEDLWRWDWWDHADQSRDETQPVALKTGTAFLDTCGLIYAPGEKGLSSFGRLSIWPLYGPWYWYHKDF